jgi:hypothetical protein
MDGFSLHANAHVHPNDRTGLERLLRYAGRPPLSLERLEERPDGKIVVQLKRAWKGGESHLAFTPLEFLARLASIVPPPRRHQVRYLGVFSSHSKVRSLVVPVTAPETEERRERRSPCQASKSPRAPGVDAASNAMESVSAVPAPEPQEGGSAPSRPGSLVSRGPTAGSKYQPDSDPIFAEVWPPPSAQAVEPATVLERRLDWAALLQRVFAVDVMTCANCGGNMRIIAFLTKPDVVQAVLAHLQLPTTPPPARAPPQLELPGWSDNDNYFADAEASDW